mgnify:CR=1 FL=1
MRSVFYNADRVFFRGQSSPVQYNMPISIVAKNINFSEPDKHTAQLKTPTGRRQTSGLFVVDLTQGSPKTVTV